MSTAVREPDLPIKPEDAARIERALRRFCGLASPEGDGEVIVTFRRGGVSAIRVSQSLK